MANEARKGLVTTFPEDMFADEQEKWSWPGGSKAAGAASNYNSEIKSDSSSSEDEEGFVLHSDSNSLKQGSSKKQVSSSGPEETSSSSVPAESTVRERSLPSIYDDDAQSGKPSADYKKDDLAFPASLRKTINSESSEPSSKEKTNHSEPSSSSSHARRKDDRNSKERRSSHGSRSGSPGRVRHARNGERRRSRSRDRYREKERKRRSRSRDGRRRSRSYDRHRRGGRRNDRYQRRHSRSRSRERSRGSGMTPQMALQQTMAAMSAKAQALTGIALPKYYNPAAVNPLKYAEQVQKRKLLWQKEEKPAEQPQPQQQPQQSNQNQQQLSSKNSVWDKLTFAQDQDGKMTAKFRKLMGIKTATDASTTALEPSLLPSEPEEKESVFKKQEELFRDLDQQYEMARMTTHTQRGVGLGYSSQALYPPPQK